MTLEAKKEKQRARFKERLEETKALGLCRNYHEPPREAIPGQTRCEECAEKHRQARRLSDAARRKRKKEERALTSEG